MKKRRSYITRVTASQARRLKSRTDWKRVDALTDADIATAIRGDTDTFETTPEMWKHARVVMPARKATITMTIDPDVLAFFKGGGKGYQTRMNAVLRSFMLNRREAR